MFVRQKRIPTILAQALMIGLDRYSYLPLLPSGVGTFMAERFIDNDKMLTHNFETRLFYQTSVAVKAALCPEAELRSPLFT
jgi:hypothetical protein